MVRGACLSIEAPPSVLLLVHVLLTLLLSQSVNRHEKTR